MEIAAERAER
jgi:hypothetical protein